MRKTQPFQTPVARALQQYSALAVKAGFTLELALCHGAVCTVAYRWVDGVRREVLPNDSCGELAAIVAETQRLRPDWVETEVAWFLANANARHTLQPDEFAPGLTLTINTGARVLAHKLHLLAAPMPSRATDARDAEFLLRKIHLASREQVDCIHDRYYPGSALSSAARQLIARTIHSVMADHSG